MAKPVVDGIEGELEGRAEVLRVNVMSDVGGELARRYSVRGVPTFVVVDGAGEVVLQQAGPPRREKLIAAVEQALSE